MSRILRLYRYISWSPGAKVARGASRAGSSGHRHGVNFETVLGVDLCHGERVLALDARCFRRRLALDAGDGNAGFDSAHADVVGAVRGIHGACGGHKGNKNGGVEELPASDEAQEHETPGEKRRRHRTGRTAIEVLGGKVPGVRSGREMDGV